MFSFTNQKRWLEEAEAQVSKINSKELDLFWLNTCGWSPKVGPTGKKSRITRPTIHRYEMMWQIQEFCVNARPKCKTHVFCWKYICPCERVQTHMTYVQLRQHIKWAGNVRIHDLICSRRGLFAKVVVRAAQEIVNTWFNLGGCEIAVSPKASDS